jgi:hypothetical protein
MLNHIGLRQREREHDAWFEKGLIKENDRSIAEIIRYDSGNEITEQ